MGRIQLADIYSATGEALDELVNEENRCPTCDRPLVAPPIKTGDGPDKCNHCIRSFNAQIFRDEQRFGGTIYGED